MMKKILFLLVMPFALNAQILTEDFESTTFPPTGWTINQVNVDKTWSPTTTATALDGNQSAVVDYDSNLGVQNEDLISPSFDLSTTTTAVLKFITRANYYWSISPNDNYDISCQISVDGGTTWTEIWDEDELAANEGGTFSASVIYDVEEDLSAYAGESDVRIKFNYSGTNGAYFVIDNIEVLDAPECDDVAGFAWGANGFTVSSVHLDWDDSHTSYDIEYGPAGFTQGNGTLVTNHTSSDYEATGLAEASAYDFYVKGNCPAPAVAGNWIYISNVYTQLDTPANLDYTINFDSTAPLHAQGWTTFNNGAANNWLINRTASFSNSPNSSVTCAYSQTESSDAWLYSRGVNVTAGDELQISFWYRVGATSFPEKMKVTIGTDRTVAAQSEVLWDNNGGTELTNNAYAEGIVTYTATTTGVYYVAFNCYSDANMFFVAVDDVSIINTLSAESMNLSENTFAMYPNPAQNILNIHLSDKFVVAKTTVSITDLTGKKVLETSNNLENINIAPLASGTYIVTVTDGEITKNQKLIKN